MDKFGVGRGCMELNDKLWKERINYGRKRYIKGIYPKGG